MTRANERRPDRKRPALEPERAIERMAWTSLRPLLSDEGERAEQTLARLKHFALELLRWNRGVSNLISRDDEARLVERHMAESLAGAAIGRGLGTQSSGKEAGSATNSKRPTLAGMHFGDRSAPRASASARA